MLSGIQQVEFFQLLNNQKVEPTFDMCFFSIGQCIFWNFVYLNYSTIIIYN